MGVPATGLVALLGDSIFDNAAYVGGRPDVVTHLRGLLPAGWEAILCAVDGAMTGDVADQLPSVPLQASHLVVSMGGNDALLNADLLSLKVGSAGEALSVFGERIARFERSYRDTLRAILDLDRETTLCTIYNGNLPDPEGSLARVALTMFNDVILRIAFEHRLSVIDLRFACSRPEDYANPIEPSDIGGRRIAAAIVNALGFGEAGSARVFA